MTHYLINLGNTHSAVVEAVRLADNPPPVASYATSSFVECWQPSGEWTATAACVVPAVRIALEQRWPRRISYIDASHYPDVDFSAYGAGLGADRMANIAAAHALNPDAPVLVIDCGTALNTIAVDAKGRFRGCVILPGRQTALAALGRQTAQLPEFTAKPLENSSNPLGLSTEEGIRNGVNLTLLAAVERIIRDTRRQSGFAACRVWMTGGDASFYVDNLPRDLAVTKAPLPLTLYGISLAKIPKVP